MTASARSPSKSWLYPRNETVPPSRCPVPTMEGGVPVPGNPYFEGHRTVEAVEHGGNGKADRRRRQLPFHADVQVTAPGDPPGDPDGVPRGEDRPAGPPDPGRIQPGGKVLPREFEAPVPIGERFDDNGPRGLLHRPEGSLDLRTTAQGETAVPGFRRPVPGVSQAERPLEAETERLPEGDRPCEPGVGCARQDLPLEDVPALPAGGAALREAYLADGEVRRPHRAVQGGEESRRKETVVDDVRQADHPAGLGAPQAAGGDPGTSRGDEENRRWDLRRGQRHLCRPPLGALHLSVDPHRRAIWERKENVPSAAPRRPSARTPESRAVPTESTRSPGRESRHFPPHRVPGGPRIPASTVPFISPGLSRWSREKTWAISILSTFPSIAVPFPPSPFAAKWNAPSPYFPSARAFQRSADPCASVVPPPPASPAAGSRGRRPARHGIVPSPLPSPPRRGSSRPPPLFPRFRRDSGSPRRRPLPGTPRPRKPNARYRTGRSPAPRPSIPKRSVTGRTVTSTFPRRWPGTVAPGRRPRYGAPPTESRRSSTAPEGGAACESRARSRKGTFSRADGTRGRRFPTLR